MQEAEEAATYSTEETAAPEMRVAILAEAEAEARRAPLAEAARAVPVGTPGMAPAATVAVGEAEAAMQAQAVAANQ
jgi:hypothetical protein